MSSSLLQVVNNLFQTGYNKQGTSSANTTCWQLVNRLVTTCLQTCNNLCVFMGVVDKLFQTFWQLRTSSKKQHVDGLFADLLQVVRFLRVYTSLWRSWFCSYLDEYFTRNGVSTMKGIRHDVLIPDFPVIISSALNASWKPIEPNLEVLYATRFCPPTRPAMEDTVTMWPWLISCMCGRNAFVVWKTLTND